MNIPDKPTRDLWRSIAENSENRFRPGVVIRLLDAVEMLEAKVAELEQQEKDDYYQALGAGPMDQ